MEAPSRAGASHAGGPYGRAAALPEAPRCRGLGTSCDAAGPGPRAQRRLAGWAGAAAGVRRSSNLEI